MPGYSKSRGCDVAQPVTTVDETREEQIINAVRMLRPVVDGLPPWAVLRAVRPDMASHRAEIARVARSGAESGMPDGTNCRIRRDLCWLLIPKPKGIMSRRTCRPKSKLVCVCVEETMRWLCSSKMSLAAFSVPNDSASHSA